MTDSITHKDCHWGSCTLNMVAVSVVLHVLKVMMSQNSSYEVHTKNLVEAKKFSGDWRLTFSGRLVTFICLHWTSFSVQHLFGRSVVKFTKWSASTLFSVQHNFYSVSLAYSLISLYNEVSFLCIIVFVWWEGNEVYSVIREQSLIELALERYSWFVT